MHGSGYDTPDSFQGLLNAAFSDDEDVQSLHAVVDFGLSELGNNHGLPQHASLPPQFQSLSKFQRAAATADTSDNGLLLQLQSQGQATAHDASHAKPLRTSLAQRQSHRRTRAKKKATVGDTVTHCSLDRHQLRSYTSIPITCHPVSSGCRCWPWSKMCSSNSLSSAC
jgi:hypothetical protein